MGLAVRFGPQRLQLHSFQVGPRYTADGQLIKHTVLGNPAECVPYCDHSPPSLSVVAVATACDLPRPAPKAERSTAVRVALQVGRSPAGCGQAADEGIAACERAAWDCAAWIDHLHGPARR